MIKKVAKTICIATLLTAVCGTTVLADDVTDIKNQKSQEQTELDSLQSQLTILLGQMDDLEIKAAKLNDEINDANQQLSDAQAKQNQQYNDMSLRIRYMYENQSSSIEEAVLTAGSMSDALNKAEYIQQVYSYDRDRMQDMVNTANQIQDLTNQLNDDKTQLEASQNEMVDKQALLYSTIMDKQSDISNLDDQLASAVAAVAAADAAKSAATANVSSTEAATAVVVAADSSSTETAAASSSSSAAASSSASTYTASDSSVGSAIVAYAYQFVGVPYVWGGSSPSGFDCSGYTQYVFAHFGISLAHSSGAQAGAGSAVGSLSEALPGDLICYPGHVAIYIGGGMVLNATQPGDIVRESPATMATITAIRRCW